jgi:PTH2 family peptidyl-tRNA hydrolase
MQLEPWTLVATAACAVLAGFALAKRDRQDDAAHLDDDDDKLTVERAPPPPGAVLKMVVVARTDLKMGKGKLAAQCCHAAVHCVQIAQERAPELLVRWETSNGSAKVVVKVDSEEELLQVASAARKAGLVHSLISDAGRTQIAAGSRTVVGVGPASDLDLAAVTGHLKLM